MPVQFPLEDEPIAPSRNRGLLVAAAVVAVAAAAWFGVRAFNQATEPETTFPAAAPPPAERRAPPASPPEATPAPAPTPPSVPQSAPPPVTTSPTPEPVVPPTAGSPSSFEIVVASFRTVTRASAVAAELAALGQPVRQRSSDGWQQVLAGPFATRIAAEEAQATLDRAGYTGTQIVPAAR